MKYPPKVDIMSLSLKPGELINFQIIFKMCCNIGRLMRRSELSSIILDAPDPHIYLFSSPAGLFLAAVSLKSPWPCALRLDVASPSLAPPLLWGVWTSANLFRSAQMPLHPAHCLLLWWQLRICPSVSTPKCSCTWLHRWLLTRHAMQSEQVELCTSYNEWHFQFWYFGTKMDLKAAGINSCFQIWIS